MRTGELELHLEKFPPMEAIRRLVEWKVNSTLGTAAFAGCSWIENIHLGRRMTKSVMLKQMAKQSFELLRGALARGIDAGVFRKDLQRVELHSVISSLCFFAVDAATCVIGPQSGRSHHFRRSLPLA
jgi:hypothetical protein